MDEPLTVGELAERTGLTVRTLHHYDEIGLLEPRDRSPAGYRLYGSEEIARLELIVSLRALGFGLDEIRACLAVGGREPIEAVERRLEEIERTIEFTEAMRDRLRGIRDRLARDRLAGDRERSLEIIKEAVSMYEYYTPEQLERLRQRGEEVGEDRMAEAQVEWREIYAELGAAMERGLDPANPEVQRLAARAVDLIAEFTGGDSGIEASLATMYREEGSKPLERHGFDISPDLWTFSSKAIAIACERSG